MLQETLIEIFERDLLQLKKEIESYSDENKLWVIKEEISNSAGNLCLHLLGNLNHFIGATLGNSGYIRNREDEFSLKNIPKDKLLSEIDKTIKAVTDALQNLSEKDFQKNFLLEKHGKIVSTEFMLLHLVTHFNYHLGQVNYHRRMI